MVRLKKPDYQPPTQSQAESELLSMVKEIKPDYEVPQSFGSKIYKTFVSEPVKYLYGQAENVARGLQPFVDPQYLLGVQDVSETGSKIIPDEPSVRTFQLDKVFRPDTSTPFGEMATENVGPTAQAVSTFFTGSPEAGSALMEKATGTPQPSLDPRLQTGSEFAGYASMVGVLRNMAMKALPEIQALVAEANLPATAITDAVTFGIEGGRRAWARGENPIDAFYQNALMGIGFSPLEAKAKSLQLTKQKTAPRVTSIFEVDPALSFANKVLDENRLAESAFKDLQASSPYGPTLPFKSPSGEGGFELGPPGGAVSTPPPFYPKGVEYGFKGTNEPFELNPPSGHEINPPPFYPKGVEFNPPSEGPLPKMEPSYEKTAIGYKPYEPSPETPVVPAKSGKTLKLYSGVPVDAVVDVFGKNQVISDLVSGKEIMKVSVRGFDPARGPISRLNALIRKLWYPESSLPQELAQAKRKMISEKAGASAMSKEFLSFRDLPPQQNALIKKITTGQVTGYEPEFLAEVNQLGLDPKYINLAQAFRSEANAIQDELVNLGLISEKAQAKHMGTYTKQMYKEHIEPSGYGKGSGTVKVIKSRKDLSPEYLEKQLVTEAGLPEASGYLQDRVRVSTAKYLDKIKSNSFYVLPDEEVASLNLPENATEINKGGWTYQKLEGVDPAAFPEGTVERKMAETYGLRGVQGKWLLKSVAEDLRAMIEMPGKLDNAFQQFTRLRQAWKFGKAVLNVPNSVGNFMYNGIIMDTAMQKTGLYSKQGRAIFRKSLNDIKTGSRDFLRQKSLGTFGGNFSREEYIDAINDILSKADDRGLFDRAMSKVEKMMEKGGRHYQFSEELGKMTLVNYAKEVEGMTDEAASAFAKKHMFDYNEVPKVVKFLRKVPGGPAFITFSFKALPRIPGYALNLSNPLRFWKYPLGLYALHEFNKDRLGFTDASLKEAMKDLPDYARKILVLVGKTEDGQPMFYDPRYMIPYSDALGTRSEVPGWSMFNSSGPETALIELYTNKRMFDDRPIFKNPRYSTMGQKISEFGEHAFRSFAPQVAVSAKNVYEAATKKKSYFTGQPYRDLTQETARAVGIPLVVPKEGLTQRKQLREVFDFEDYIKQVQKDQSLSEEQKTNYVQQALEKYNSRVEKLQ